MVNASPERNFPNTEICLPFAQTDRFARVNGKQALISFSNKNVSRAVWLSSSRVTQICCLISEKRFVRIRQSLVRSFVSDCFVGAHDGFTK